MPPNSWQRPACHYFANNTAISVGNNSTVGAGNGNNNHSTVIGDNSLAFAGAPNLTSVLGGNQTVTATGDNVHKP